jgi:Domain of unknown function (DUF4912)
MTASHPDTLSQADVDSLDAGLGELPSSYGVNRLVLLPVDPYLVHAYWEIDSPPDPREHVTPVLRFYEAVAPGAEGRPFDVDIDLQQHHSYVPLWSPGKIYQAELGLRADDGSFVPVASSNTVQTPPAEPQPAVISPAAFEATDSKSNDAEPNDVEPDAAALAPAAVSPEVVARLQQRLAELFAYYSQLPPLTESLAGAFSLPAEFGGSEFASSEFGSDEFEAFGSRSSRIEAFRLARAASGLTSLAGFDLTTYSEERFISGISSQDGSLER